MPIIEYLCKNCDHKQERLEYGNPVPRMRCDNCAKFSYKVISAPVAHFKGPGFHCNDYPKPDAGDMY